MSKKREITYTVGATLDGPIVVKHDVIEEDLPKKTFAQPNAQTTKKIKQTAKAVDNKRTRGQSQKSVRMNHKKG